MHATTLLILMGMAVFTAAIPAPAPIPVPSPDPVTYDDGSYKPWLYPGDDGSYKPWLYPGYDGTATGSSTTTGSSSSTGTSIVYSNGAAVVTWKVDMTHASIWIGVCALVFKFAIGF
ncbi:uncharacterized protein SAPINGB_P000964 [Magnusiomyces paraingens]|uniref:Uncharacterized protein n=1 Tax=Magnusiomyces paraingens TaxID=2606893 RepID=A0A5E8B3A5_9ASCO|nr:uncharacterized protein SAPINGB_P000964 [Saprochaete ingens]VVT45934.1 unnamed protein product [Saprochaete ingens]